MPLPVPALDDRSFEQLVAEGVSLIPRYTRDWTDHNTSDPGITLLELFAYLAETAIFQLDQVPTPILERGLELLGEPRASSGEDVDDTTARALRNLERPLDAPLDLARRPLRVVTAEEYERLALRVQGARVARARLIVVEDPLQHAPPLHDGEPALVPFLVIVAAADRDRHGRALRRLCDAIFRAIRRCTLVATRLHVVGPGWKSVHVDTVVVRRPGSGLTAQDVQAAVVRFLDPLTGGPQGDGWTFGRSVYRSELFQALEQMPGVDHVEELTLRAAPAAASPDAIALGPTELVEAPLDHVTVQVKDPVGG